MITISSSLTTSSPLHDRLFKFLVILIIFVNIIICCDMDQTQHGCRIDNGACTCSFGCKSEFRYATRKECQDALKGTSGDICSRQPCLNGGSCIQISQMPGYKCRCEGTGYWGNRCQRLCPSPSERHISHFSYECVVI